MLDKIKRVLPNDIEKRSFEIITEELGDKKINPSYLPIVKRVIHTTADFSYADNLCFSENAIEKVSKAIKSGVSIVTDTKMVSVGINSKVLNSFGGKVYCFMDNEEVANIAKQRNVTRSAICMEMAANLNQKCIFAIGNAPTALIRLYELINENKIKPEFIIGVPVGFVNVIEAKELIMQTDIPYIVSKGRKGGSTVAVAICNALLYKTKGEVIDEKGYKTI